MYLHRAAGAKDEPLGPSNYSEYDRARFDRPRWQAGKQAAKKKGKKRNTYSIFARSLLAICSRRGRDRHSFVLPTPQLSIDQFHCGQIMKTAAAAVAAATAPSNAKSLTGLVGVTRHDASGESAEKRPPRCWRKGEKKGGRAAGLPHPLTGDSRAHRGEDRAAGSRRSGQAVARKLVMLCFPFILLGLSASCFPDYFAAVRNFPMRKLGPPGAPRVLAHLTHVRSWFGDMQGGNRKCTPARCVFLADRRGLTGSDLACLKIGRRSVSGLAVPLSLYVNS